MVIEDFHDLLAEFVIQGSQNHGSLFQIDKIDFNRSIFSRLGIKDHPVITACDAHTVLGRLKV
jgi:hypothetical protein